MSLICLSVCVCAFTLALHLLLACHDLLVELLSFLQIVFYSLFYIRLRGAIGQAVNSIWCV